MATKSEGWPWLGSLQFSLRGFFGGSPPASTSKEGRSREMNDRARVELVRGVRNEDLETILGWVSHPEVRRHLDPAPQIPNDWNNKDEVGETISKLAEYYNNFGEPRKIMPLAAANKDGEILGVGTIRWHGDPYVPEGERIASIERLMINPELHDRGIGTVLMATMIEFAFDKFQGYRGLGAKEIRAWVMEDRQASPWEKNQGFMRKFGFQAVSSGPHWREYAAKRGIDTAGRDATWYRLKPEWYRAQKEKGNIQPCQMINFDALR